MMRRITENKMIESIGVLLKCIQNVCNMISKYKKTHFTACKLLLITIWCVIVIIIIDYI